MERPDIIARRRRLQVPDEIQDQWVTLADVGFDGEWVSPIQKISNSIRGPVLVAKHWFDAESVDLNREVFECLRYCQATDSISVLIGPWHMSEKRVRTFTLHWRATSCEARQAKESAGQTDEALRGGGDPP